MKEIRETLIEIAHAAGQEIMAVKNLGTSATTKADGSPVTEADLRANVIITEKLAEFDTSIPVVSEESDFRPQGTRFWLVDPLDGTKEFLNGFSDFTVNIALIEDALPIAGIVHLPATGLSYCADQSGAFKTSDGEFWPIQVSQIDQKPRVVTSRSHLDNRTVEFLDSTQFGDVIQAGSSLKFCLIAEGLAEIYPRFGRTMEWDTAAGQAVLRAAGGMVLREDNLTELSYGKWNLENPGFIAVSNDGLLRDDIRR